MTCMRALGPAHLYRWSSQPPFILTLDMQIEGKGAVTFVIRLHVSLMHVIPSGFLQQSLQFGVRCTVASVNPYQ